MIRGLFYLGVASLIVGGMLVVEWANMMSVSIGFTLIAVALAAFIIGRLWAQRKR